jgi:hypothetical protein
MPTVRILRQLTGARDGVAWPAPGDTLDVPEAEADDLERIGIAERVSAKSTITAAPEAATAPKAETATTPKPRARKA